MIAPAVAGNGLTDTGNAALAVPLPQAFVGVTVTLPDTDPRLIVIEFVFNPEVIVEPEGTTQL